MASAWLASTRAVVWTCSSPDESSGNGFRDDLVDRAVQVLLPQLRRHDVDVKIDSLQQKQHTMLYTVKIYPYIYGYFVTNFPYFNEPPWLHNCFLPALLGGDTLKLTKGSGFSQLLRSPNGSLYGYLPHAFSTLDQFIDHSHEKLFFLYPHTTLKMFCIPQPKNSSHYCRGKTGACMQWSLQKTNSFAYT